MNLHKLSHNKKIRLLFHQTSLKFCGYLKNSNKQDLFLEFLREDLQNNLLDIVLKEFLFLILDLRKSKFKSATSIKVDFILKVLIINSETRFINTFPRKIGRINYDLKDALWLTKVLEIEENYSLKILLNYLIFEDTKILDENKFTRIFMEHLVLKISETLTRLFLIQGLLDFCFLKSYPKSHFTFSTMVAQFRNDLYWSSYFNLILMHSKYIYNNTYLIWTIIDKKICYKNIYLLKASGELELTNIQSFTLVYLETVDFLKLKMQEIFTLIKKER